MPEVIPIVTTNDATNWRLQLSVSGITFLDITLRKNIGGWQTPRLMAILIFEFIAKLCRAFAPSNVDCDPMLNQVRNLDR